MKNNTSSSLACVGNTQCCLRDELAGIGTPNEPGQINEWRDPDGGGLQARSQLVEDLLSKLGR